MTLKDEYQRRCTEWSDIHEHLPTLFQHVMDAPENPRILELGTRTGNSTAAFLYGCLVKQTGTVQSVDLDIPDVPDEWFQYAWWNFDRGSSTEPLITESIADRDFDIVFIDTSHTYEQTLDELITYVPKVKPGGVVLLHDTELVSDVCGVARALDEYTRDAQGLWHPGVELHWTNNPACYGLGTLRIPA